jgi:hypothetical protein
MKVVKSAEHYTETAVDEIKLLRSVSMNLVNHTHQHDVKPDIFICKNATFSSLSLCSPFPFRHFVLIKNIYIFPVFLCVCFVGEKHRP